MKVYFMFRPCNDGSFEMIPQGKIERKVLVQTIVDNFNGKIINNSLKLTLINIGKGKISVSKNNKIIIRGIRDEEEAKKIANTIMSELLK